jgi:DNA modification methylase
VIRDRCRILVGDAVTRLRELPAGSIHACITSPPYYALRDYGTGKWEGGDAGCDHKAPPGGGKVPGSGLAGPGNREGYSADGQFRAVCGKCGAKRIDKQIGMEQTPAEYVARLVEVFGEVRRVLRDDGVLWLNLGDSYNSSPPGNKAPMSKSGLNGAQTSKRYRDRLEDTQQRQQEGRKLIDGIKPKDLLGIPWQVAFALRDAGWYLRAAVPWLKANPMPESVTDRPSTSHEMVFLLAKRSRYFWDAEEVKRNGEPYRVKQPDGWQSGPGAHGTIHHQGREHGLTTDEVRAGRSLRTADFWFDSLDSAIDAARAHLAHLEDVKRSGGLLLDEAGEPLGFAVNPKGFKGAHFATFPERLVSEMVKAATSAEGCCPACGAPWKRQTERQRKPTRPGDGSKILKSAEHRDDIDPEINWRNSTLNYGNRDPQRHVTHTATLGWLPTCTCEAGEAVPCRVLDPFAGAGTTLLVALKLGRHGVGVELNSEYARMAEERIAADAGAMPGLFDAPAVSATITPSLFAEDS